MFKYTPAKANLRKLRKIRGSPYRPNVECDFLISMVPDKSYAGYFALWKFYDGFKFYSSTRLRQVPINGILMPVKLFDCEEIPDAQPDFTAEESWDAWMKLNDAEEKDDVV